MVRSTPIRIGVMGCANIARRSVLPAMRSMDLFRLVGVASRIQEKGISFAREFDCEFIGDYDALVRREDVDAIYMPLPTGLHFEWATKALDANKHLLVEKSLACNLAQAESLSSKACRNGLVLMENYMFEYHAQQVAVRDIVHTSLGEVRLFRATFCFPPLDPANFRYDSALGGGALLDAGGYALKACQLFVPGEIEVLASTLNRNSSGTDVWGAAMLSAESESEQIPIHISFGFDQFYQCSIEFIGQRAKLSTSRTFTAGPGIAPFALLDKPDGTAKIELPADNHFVRILQEFHDRIRSGRTQRFAEENVRQARLQEDVRLLASGHRR
jgi:dTDP-3,4-didehydro-2,6-dideoxy-alpha-D-glucose 3-reductase